MTVETATKISQLNALFPPGSDPKSEGDNHLRLLKSVLQATFDDSGTYLKTTLPLNSASPAQRGFINGLTLANNGADAANGIDIAPGAAATDDPATPYVMSLTSLLTKKVNSAWAVGSGNGGLDTGTVSATANYHVWLIQRSDTGVIDALFSLSGTAPAMPASYDRKRRLGLVIRNTGAILAFRQFNRRVLLGTVQVTRNSVTAVSNILLSFLATSGVRLRPIFQSNITAGASASALNQFADGDAAAILITINIANYGTAGGQDATVVDGVFVTDTSGNLRYTASGTATGNSINMLGWYDDIQV